MIAQRAHTTGALQASAAAYKTPNEKLHVCRFAGGWRERHGAGARHQALCTDDHDGRDRRHLLLQVERRGRRHRAAHVDCAKICILEKGAQVGILTDGDGLFKLWGAMAKDKYAKVMPYLGQQVEITGTEVTLSNNYDLRSFDLQTVKRIGK